MIRVVSLCLITMTFNFVFSMSNDVQEMNECTKIMETFHILKMQIIKQKYKNGCLTRTYNFMLNASYLKILKKMVKIEALITKKGVKLELITSNKYGKWLFKFFFEQISPDEKDDLLEYALDKTSYDMLCFLVELGAQIDSPWSYYEEPYTQYLSKQENTPEGTLITKVRGSRIH